MVLLENRNEEENTISSDCSTYTKTLSSGLGNRLHANWNIKESSVAFLKNKNII